MFFSSKKKYYIGIDLGGTNIAAAVVDDAGNIYGRANCKTNANRSSVEIFDDMVKCAIDSAINSGLKIENIECIGIGVPGAVNYKNGYAFDCNNLTSINGEPMADFISAKLCNNKVYIENDANAAAWGEFLFGCGKEAEKFVMITLGTGIGGGIIANGKIYRGYSGNTAEFGHMVIELNGNKCSCGRKGCFEAYASASALVKMTKEKMKENPDSDMWKIAEGKLSNVDGSTPFKAKDKVAKEVLREYTYYLSEGIASIIKVLDPDVLCIGGGISNAGDRLLKMVEKNVNKYFGKKGIDNYSDIKIATLNNDAGILGAALIWKNLEKK